MDGVALQDRVSRGRGRAARKLGAPYVVYRPSAASLPLQARNRVLRLYAAFGSGDMSTGETVPASGALCCGILDASYTAGGDYLVGEEATYFIASQLSGGPVLCVRTNRIVSASRQAASNVTGYGGRVRGQDTSLLAGWPASITSVTAHAGIALAQDARFAGVTVLLPQLPTALRVGDTITDEIGQAYVVDGVEQTAMGWRCAGRQVSA